MTGLLLLGLRLAATLALYAFLAWALWTLWRNLKQQADRLASRLAPPITLIPAAGDDEKPHYFAIPEVLIGRNPVCDCWLDDKTVSANHARLSYHHGQWWIEDLGSTNGTFLNQEPVTTPLVVTSGDELRCGQATFTLTIGDWRESHA